MFSGSTLPFHKLSQGWRRGEGGRGQGSGKSSGETGKGQGKQAWPERLLESQRPRLSFYSQALGHGVEVFRTERKDWAQGGGRTGGCERTLGGNTGGHAGRFSLLNTISHLPSS